MEILVTGGSGFIGSYVVDELLAQGHRVAVLDLKPPVRTDVEYTRASITDIGATEQAVANADVVYHFAAFSNIDRVRENPRDTIDFNVMGTVTLLEACRRKGVERFLLASSVYVYDDGGHLYTTSKLAAERLCRDYQNLYGLPFTVLRLSTAYGPRSRMEDVISIFVSRAIAGETLHVRGSGKQRRNFIYAEDIAMGAVAALTDGAENQTMILAGEEAVSIAELAFEVSRVFPTCPEVVVGQPDDRVADYSGEIGDLSASMEALNWRPTTCLREGIRAVGEYVRNLEAGE